MENQSCEINYYKFTFYIVMVLGVIIFLPSSILFFALSDSDLSALAVWFVLLGITYFPFLIYYGYKFRYYSKLKPKYIQEVKLESVRGGFSRRLYFSLTMEIAGKMRKVNTLAIFNIYFGPNIIDEYSAKKALVGYDEKNDVAVVLKVLT